VPPAAAADLGDARRLGRTALSGEVSTTRKKHGKGLGKGYGKW
jgi:hypothetical protein